MMLDTWTGQETANGASASLAILWVPDPSRKGKEMHISNTIRESRLGISQIRSTVFDAAPGKIDDFGRWFNTVYDIPEGILLKIKTKRSTGIFGRPVAMSTLYVQMRDGAAQRRMTFQATGLPMMARNAYTIMGRFDLLATEEERLAAGIVSPFWEKRELDTISLLEMEILQEESKARARMRARPIVTLSGDEVAVISKTRRRSLDI